MSHLVCPLCGKSSSLRNFDPSGFDLDIYGQDVVGLGRGRGFAVTGKSSLLHSEITGIIKQRLLDLLLMLCENGLLSRSELEKLGLAVHDSDEVKATSAMLEEKDETIDALNEEVHALRASKEEGDDAVREIIQFVEDSLGSEFEVDENDEPLNALKDLVERLVEEHMALKADQEEIENES